MWFFSRSRGRLELEELEAASMSAASGRLSSSLLFKSTVSVIHFRRASCRRPEDVRGDCYPLNVTPRTLLRIGAEALVSHLVAHSVCGLLAAAMALVAGKT